MIQRPRISTIKKKKILLKALENSLGVLTPALLKADITRMTYHRWLESDEKFKELIDDVKFMVKDFGESCQLKGMKEGNPQLILHFQKTKNRDRGYGEVSEIIHKGDIEFKFGKLVSDENDE